MKIKINSTEYEIPTEMRVVDAVKKYAGIQIPTLCYEERLGHINSCFLCVTEIKGASKLLPACSTMIADGMEIETDSENVLAARREALSLLLSDHCADCYSPCSLTCPAGIDIQGYLKLASQSRFEEALELIKERNPLPIACGRVCVHSCELKCRRAIHDSAVRINYVKRTAAEGGGDKKAKTLPKKELKFAAIGAGPASLSFAYYAALGGAEVTIYEAMPEAGGMLRYGIPEYRLPKKLLDREISELSESGVTIKCNERVDRERFKELEARYDRIFIGVGAWQSSDPHILNSEHPDCVSGIQFLARIAMGENLDLSQERVLIIGGGNTAIDAARTAIRSGALSVTMLYRRSEKEMPAHPEEIAAAKEEGVELKILTVPKELLIDNGKICGIRCIQSKLGEPDKSGRCSVAEIDGSDFVEKGSFVITATGQKAELSCIDSSLIERGRVITDKNGNCNAQLLAGGDCVTGAATVIEAIAAGRRAAMSALGTPEKINFRVSKDFFGEVKKEQISDGAPHSAVRLKERAAELRSHDFIEVDSTLTCDEAKHEAERCLSCGCSAVESCLLKRYASKYGVRSTYTKGERRLYKPQIGDSPIIYDPAKCIKCQRCIKTCEKLHGRSYIALIGRGFEVMVQPYFQKEYGCDLCGNCVSSCPTGALSLKNGYMPYYKQKERSKCMLCSAGCDIEIRSYGREARVASARSKESGEGDYLCSRQFEMEELLQKSPIQPMAKIDGKLQNCSYTEAAAILAEKLSFGQIDIGISENLSYEEMYAIHNFIDKFRDRVNVLGVAKSEFLSTIELASLLESQLILCHGELVEKMPALKWYLREAHAKGAELFFFGENPMPDISKSVCGESLNKFFNSGYNGTKSVKLEDTKIAIICDADEKLEQLHATFKMTEGQNDPSIAGRGVLLVEKGINSRGFKQIFKEYNRERFEAQERMQLFFGEDVALEKNSDFKVCFARYMTPQLKDADLILPCELLAEERATLLTLHGQVSLPRAIEKRAAHSLPELLQMI